jgi:hypothetical protein
MVKNVTSDKVFLICSETRPLYFLAKRGFKWYSIAETTILNKEVNDKIFIWEGLNPVYYLIRYHTVTAYLRPVP